MDNKSTFISVIAWLYIIFFSFSTIMSGLQIYTIFSILENIMDDNILKAAMFSIGPITINPIASLILLLGFNLFMFTSSLLLLKRNSLGRILFTIGNSFISIFFLVSLLYRSDDSLFKTFGEDGSMGSYLKTMNIIMIILGLIFILAITMISVGVNRKRYNKEFEVKKKQTQMHSTTTDN